MIRAPVLLALLAPAAFAQVSTPFDAAVLVAEADVRLVKTLDLDGNGWMDAISAHQMVISSTPVYRIMAHFNDSTGALTRGWSFDLTALGSFNNTVEPHDRFDVADLNGDGRQDFAVAYGFGVKVYLSNGALPPTEIVHVFGSQDYFRALTFGDFDSDGDLDIAVLRIDAIQIYDIDVPASAMVLRSSMTVPPGDPVRRLVVGEFSGDGTADVYAAGSRIYPVANGVIQAPISFSAPWSAWPGFDLRPESGDVDGDGDVDLITFYTRPTGEHGYRILRRTSPAQFVEEPLVTTGGPARRLFDMDGDGDLDGVCCGGGGGTPANENSLASTFRIALNDGTGVFANAIELPGLGSSAIAGVNDMDHDGRVDIVAGRCIYFQRRALGASITTTLGSGQQSRRTITDQDGDRDPDFDVLPWSVRHNRGDGQTSIDPVFVPAPPSGLVQTGQGHHGDWDGDGDEDVLVLVVGQGGLAGLHLLRNVGAGVFESGGLVAGPTGLDDFPTFVDDGMAEDVDGDGDLDLVLRSFTSTLYGIMKSGWWRNDGSAGFAYKTTFANFVALRVLDVDSDGVPDIVGSLTFAAQGKLVTLAWMRGLGNESFGGPTLLSASTQYYAYDFGDLDSDGDVDMVGVPLTTSGQVTFPRVLWNQGGGSFTAEDLALDLYRSAEISSATILDVDRDGRLDFVVGAVSTAYGACAVFTRRGDNSGWNAPILQVLTGASASSTFTRTVSADIDGDGDNDFVSADRCFENLHFDGAGAGSRLQRDDGFAGSGGVRPLLGAQGPFRVGEQVRIVLRGARPATRAWLASVTSDGVPPLTLPTSLISRPPYDPRVLRFTTSGLPGGSAGSGSCEIAFTVPPILAGVTRHYTMIVQDQAAHGGRAISNTLSITFGP